MNQLHRQGFSSLKAGGFHWDALPLRLFDKGNRKFWNPRDIDFSQDAKDWQELGDNVGSGPDADHLHNGFMNSQVHRDEILHATYTEVGVGCYWAGNVLYVTEIFRLPERAKAPAASRAGRLRRIDRDHPPRNPTILSDRPLRGSGRSAPGR